MELIVVIHASEEQEAIAQSRRLGLTGMDIVYIYTSGVTIDFNKTSRDVGMVPPNQQ